MFIKEKVVREYEGKEFRSTMVFGVGNLTADVNTRTVMAQGEEKSVTDGRSSIAFNIKVDGEDKAVFYQIDAWEKTAEILAQYGTKGRRLFVSGKEKVEKYTTEEGEERAVNVLMLERFRFLDYEENLNKEDTSKTEDLGGIEGFNPTDDEDIPF